MLWTATLFHVQVLQTYLGRTFGYRPWYPAKWGWHPEVHSAALVFSPHGHLWTIWWQLAVLHEYKKALTNQKLPLHDNLVHLPYTWFNATNILGSWKSFFFFSSSSFNSEYTWCLQWAVSDVNNPHLIDDPTVELPGFLFHQRQWITINCIRIFHGRCAHPMHKWRIEDLPQCECGDLQTIKHIVNNCFVF